MTGNHDDELDAIDLSMIVMIIMNFNSYVSLAILFIVTFFNSFCFVLLFFPFFLHETIYTRQMLAVFHFYYRK